VSLYCGRPLSVFRLMEDSPKLHPSPKILLPDPELYDRVNEGVTPRAGEKGRAMENDDVPLAALTENFSSIPFMAPPPFGSTIEGISIALDFVFPLSVFSRLGDASLSVAEFMDCLNMMTGQAIHQLLVGVMPDLISVYLLYR
jgi:hypothetical protein